MIEKLPFTEIHTGGEDMVDRVEFRPVAPYEMQHKINELVDTVNELQNRIDPPSVYQVMKDKDAIIGKHIGEKQRLQDELDRTRKALEIAVNALKFYSDKPGNWLYGEFQGDYNETPSEIADEALNKIKTALEQKDVK